MNKACVSKNLRPMARLGPARPVLSGTGKVTSDGKTQTLTPGMAAYLYDGAVVGIRQTGEEPLALIISYPVKPHADGKAR